MSEMESSAGYPDSPMDQDDVPYLCKGCGEVWYHRKWLLGVCRIDCILYL